MASLLASPTAPLSRAHTLPPLTPTASGFSALSLGTIPPAAQTVASIATFDVAAETTAMQSQLDSYFTKQRTGVEAASARLHRAQAALEVESERVQTALAEMDINKERAKQKVLDYKRQMLELHSEIAQLKVEEQTLPAGLQVLSMEQMKAREAISELRATAEQKAKDHAYQIQQLTKGVGFYTSRLGLNIAADAVEGSEEARVTMKFTLLNPIIPQTEYCCTICVTDDNNLELVSTSHRIPEQEELVRFLRSERNFALFACRIRKAFKKIAESGC